MKKIFFSIFRLLAVVLIMTPLFGALAQAAEDPDAKQPIHITSDRLEAYDEKRLVIFIGHAVAIQGKRVIRADRLLIYYKDKAASGEKPAKAPSGGVSQSGELDRIEAKGKVNITQEKRIVTGDDAVFEQDVQQIIVTGNAVMREGNNVVRGDKITVLLNENRGIVEGQPRKRVSATIFPNEKPAVKDAKP